MPLPNKNAGRRLRFHSSRNLWPDVAEGPIKLRAEADRLPLVGPESRVERTRREERALAHRPMSSDRLSLNRVSRHQSPSPFLRHVQLKHALSAEGRKRDILLAEDRNFLLCVDKQSRSLDTVFGYC